MAGQDVELIIEQTITRREFDDLAKEFKKEIVQSGLDSILTESTQSLKTELKSILNEQIRTTNNTDPSVKPEAENGLSQVPPNPPKSDAEIAKFLTGGKVDITQYNKANDYNTLSQAGIVFSDVSRGRDIANRIDIKMNIDESETVETQYNKAKELFSNTMFGLLNPDGTYSYYINPGLDITQYVKIKCSTLTGAGNSKPKKGFSPAERFEMNKRGKGFSEWTLKQDAVDFIRNKFLDITPVMNFIKDGDYDRATAIAKNLVTKSNSQNVEQLEEVVNQTQKLQTKSSSPVLGSISDYANAINLINGIQVSKKLDKDSATYSLVSSYDDFSTGSDNFLETILNGIRSWVVENEELWFNKLVEKVTSLIEKF